MVSLIRDKQIIEIIWNNCRVGAVEFGFICDLLDKLGNLDYHTLS